MRYVKAMILGTLLGTLPVLPAVAATAGQRHDGTVRTVNPKTGILTLDELGANARKQTLRVHVTPATRLVLSERIPKPADLRQEFKDTPIALSAIKPGDYVVVDLPHGTKAAPALVMVTARAAR
jgi:hypothetical protein